MDDLLLLIHAWSQPDTDLVSFCFGLYMYMAAGFFSVLGYNFLVIVGPVTSTQRAVMNGFKKIRLSGSIPSI